MWNYLLPQEFPVNNCSARSQDFNHNNLSNILIKEVKINDFHRWIVLYAVWYVYICAECPHYISGIVWISRKLRAHRKNVSHYTLQGGQFPNSLEILHQTMKSISVFKCIKLIQSVILISNWWEIIRRFNIYETSKLFANSVCTLSFT